MHWARVHVNGISYEADFLSKNTRSLRDLSATVDVKRQI